MDPQAPAGGGRPSYVSPILQGAGIAASAYGSYLQSQQADQQYQLALQAWQQEQERQKRLDAQNLEQQGVQNGLAAGNYATNQVKDAGSSYLDYARRLGLAG